VVQNRRAKWAVAGLVAVAVAVAAVGTAVAPSVWAQGPEPGAKAAAKPARGKVPNNVVVKKGDPLAAVRPATTALETFHYKLKLHAIDGVTLATSFYPSRLETNAPVVLLVHERERSSKDFEDPIDELKKLGLAEHLQSLGYAVLSFDLRGHGANTRKTLSDREWDAMVDDLQSAYLFLVDQHNRGQLNLSKLGVVGLGEGANLAAAWAYLPAGAVSTEGRLSDISALVLVSPVARSAGINFTTLMNALAPRIPLLLMAGERDAPSHDAIKKVRGNVEKVRLNRIELFPSSLHGYKLLNLEPRAASVIIRFLEGHTKLKSTEWEPRFNLTPVTYSDIEVVRHAKSPAAKEKEKAKAKAKEAPAKAKEEAKEEAPKAKEPADDAKDNEAK
jgi:pimeloyl-ACP methyl ester carboxylesterase